MSDIDRSRRSERPSPSPQATAAAMRHKPPPKTAAEAQKALLDKLFVDPSKEAYIPKAPEAKTIAPARDMIPNVQGSSAGAGSGEFHVYKQARRREFERLKIMEDEEAKELAAEDFKTRRETMKAADEERMAKNRAKRLKQKAKRDKKGKTRSTATTNGATSKARPSEAVSDSSDSSDDSDGGSGRQKKRRLGQGAPGTVVFRGGTDERAKDDGQSREDHVGEKREEQVVNHPESSAPVAKTAGINIVDDD